MQVIAVTSLGVFAACSSTRSPSPPVDNLPPATVKIDRPKEGDSFEITPDETDVALVVNVTNFTLVPLGEEGADMRKGQVRVFVDGPDCNDLGEGAEAPFPYNRILPNAEGKSEIGLDYCARGVPALENTSHTLRAELWHGEKKLEPFDQIGFRTTFSFGNADAGKDAQGSD